jgi:hypothetical protein
LTFVLPKYFVIDITIDDRIMRLLLLVAAVVVVVVSIVYQCEAGNNSKHDYVEIDWEESDLSDSNEYWEELHSQRLSWDINSSSAENSEDSGGSDENRQSGHNHRPLAADALPLQPDETTTTTKNDL